MGKTLIVVDMQNDFINGSLGTEEARAIIPAVENKIADYSVRDDYHIIFTRDTHYSDYLSTSEGKKLPVPHCLLETEGWEIVSSLTDFCFKEAEYVNKHTFGYDGWEWFGFEAVESIELVGVCTDICVISNALILKAMYPEIEITVNASCCAGVTPEKHKAALEVMKSCQINVIGE